MPQYKHDVSLTLLRLELGLQYTFAPAWDAIVRLPWEQKTQRASLIAIEPASSSERQAMQRNIDLHHRSVTLRGTGDAMVLARHRATNRAIAAGFTIPTGSTRDDPYHLGDQGREHLHIQFGSGTFDPLLEAAFGWMHFSGRFPLYENSHGFRAAPDATLSVLGRRRPFRLEATLFAQGYGYWNGKRDANTGLIGTSVAAGVTFRVRSLDLSIDIRQPVSQRTLREGDAFQQGTIVVMGISLAR